MRSHVCKMIPPNKIGTNWTKSVVMGDKQTVAGMPGRGVRYWHLADKPIAFESVRYWGYSGHRH